MVLDNVVSCNKGVHLSTLNKMKGKVFQVRLADTTLTGQKKYQVGKYTLWIKEMYLKKVDFKIFFNNLEETNV